MKKRTLIAISILLFASVCFAGQYQSSETSGEKTTDTLIYTGRCVVTAIDIFTNGSDAATVALYDNTSGSGKVIFPSTVVAGADGHLGKTWPFPVRAYTGLYVTVSGTTASVSVDYIAE